MQNFRRAKFEWHSAISFGPLGPGLVENCNGCDFTTAPGFVEPTVLGLLTAGGPRASPTQSRKIFLKPVGEGLKVNRPKAERSHPGVCPSRGPVWDRPLRKERTAINRPKAFTLGGRCRANARRMRGQVATHFVGADPCGRPWRSPHPVGRGLLDAPRTSAGRSRTGPYVKNRRFLDTP